MQSGTSYNSFFDKKIARSFTQEYARLVGCEGVSSQEMYRCFMNASAETLISKQFEMNVESFRYPYTTANYRL